MKKLLLTAAAFAFVSTPALAEDHGKHDGEHMMKMEHMDKTERQEKMMDHMMSKFDTDGDGMISKAEHTAHWDSKFDEMDTDGDGQLNEEELKAHKAERREHMKEKWEMRKEMKEKRSEHIDDMDDGAEE